MRYNIIFHAHALSEVWIAKSACRRRHVFPATELHSVFCYHQYMVSKHYGAIIAYNFMPVININYVVLHGNKYYYSQTNKIVA